MGSYVSMTGSGYLGYGYEEGIGSGYLGYGYGTGSDAEAGYLGFQVKNYFKGTSGKTVSSATIYLTLEPVAKKPMTDITIMLEYKNPSDNNQKGTLKLQLNDLKLSKKTVLSVDLKKILPKDIILALLNGKPIRGKMKSKTGKLTGLSIGFKP